MVPVVTELVVISCDACAHVLGAFTADAVRRLAARCAALNVSHPGVLRNWTDHYEFARSAEARASGESPFLSRSGRATLFAVRWRTSRAYEGAVSSASQELHGYADALGREGRAHPAGPYSVSMTGRMVRYDEAMAATIKDTKMAVFIFPALLLVFGLRVRSLRLMVLPVLTLPTSVSVSFAIMAAIRSAFDSASPMTPPIMGFWSCALCVDYSLFMCSRFVDERRCGKDVQEAAEAMVRCSGKIVLMSGCVLTLGYLVLVVLLPVDSIRVIGIGATVSIVVCVAVHLTLIPAAILGFPGAFRGAWGASAGARCWSRYAAAATTRLGGAAALVLVAAVCTALIAVHLPEFRESYVSSLAYPRNSRTSTTARLIASEFPGGELDPTYILVSPPEDSVESHYGIYSNLYFGELIDMVDSLLRDLSGEPFHLSATNMSSIAFLPAANVSGVPCLRGKDVVPEFCSTVCCMNWDIAGRVLDSCNSGGRGAEYCALVRRLTSATAAHSAVAIKVPWDPEGPLMEQFLPALRASLDRDTDGFNFYDNSRISGSLVVNSFAPVYEAAALSQQRAWLAIPLSSLLAFGVVALSFGTWLAPLKMIFTIAMPILLVYSVTAWVYQGGALSWTGLASLQPSPIFWLDFTVTCTTLIGLALDYDIFLFARIYELRFEGCTNREAVCRALALTGPTITTAGLMMAMSFGGLLLSDIPCNNQVGFIISFGVLVDTFVIRTFFMPAVLMLAGDWNYWPKRPPPARSGLLSCEEPLPGAAAGA